MGCEYSEGENHVMPSLPSTDLELVRGLHARDAKALTRVYGDYHAAVYNLCARILGDREEAKDMTQEVFLKAFRKPPAATEDVRLRAWLYRVATNACLNSVRGRRSSGPMEAELLPAKGDPYEQAQTAALIESSLAGMNERYRAALVLKDLHGFEGRELAEVLGVSRPAADVLVHRARASFRRVFTGLAGKDATAPANLALALPMLAVPAALQTLPALSGHAPAALGGAPAAGAAAASGAAPAVGLIAKIGAALSTKAAVIAAGASLVAGGSIAAVELAGNGAAPAPASTGDRVSASAGHPGSAEHGAGDGAGHDGGGWAEHRGLIADHLAGAHHGAEGSHHATGAHDAAHDGGGSGSHHAADTGHTSSVPHDSTATSAGSSGTHSGTTTHDGGDSAHDESGEH
jgi:RNA polymerase sigma-70 factor (ECF subfamily)